MPNISDRRGGGGGGDFLIKVGTDVRRVQNLGRAKSARKPNARQKVPKNPMTGQVFKNFRVPEFEILSKIAKSLMPGQNLAPKT